MTTKRKQQPQTHIEGRKDEHLKLLAQLERLELVDSCCYICHCDCYSTHGSSTTAQAGETVSVEIEATTSHQLDARLAAFEALERNEKNAKRRKSRRDDSGDETSSKGRRSRVSQQKKEMPNVMHAEETPTKYQTLPTQRRTSKEHGQCASSTGNRRAKSVSNKRSRSQRHPVPKQSTQRTHYTRDCKILQVLLDSLDDSQSQLSISGKAKSKSQQFLHISNSSLKSKSKKLSQSTTELAPLIGTSSHRNVKLCSSMANLCLAPMVREAFQHMPVHDKKILNRMAVKRSEQAVNKEHAWLARKYWENERLERELLKCEQLEEYKRAVHDKQFQDYLETKARLNVLAQRDLNELQRLRASLHEKDERARQRLTALRMERDMQLYQRRCDELRRSEAVTVQQEEQQLDETLRKRDICQRLKERLRRADELRSQFLEGYLKRLQYDNYMEELQHEEQWRQRQQLEQYKREQLQAKVQRKRLQSQHFVDSRQRRNEAQTRTAKISASLRELVRQSVTPDAAAYGSILGAGTTAAASFYEQNQASLNRLLLDCDSGAAADLLTK